MPAAAGVPADQLKIFWSTRAAFVNCGMTDHSAIFDYHRSMIAYHGNTGPAALGWTNRENQLIRFRVLSEMAGLDHCSILDAGCGHGDLLGYLLNRYPAITYTGIEQIPEFLAEAGKRYGLLPAATFLEGDFTRDALPPADYVLLSGALNYYQEDPDFIYGAISRLYAVSRKGFGFNLLRRVIPNGLLAAYNPDDICAYCRTLGAEVRLRLDYSDEDFTVYLYR
ncbi:class I SAM-dependent methyltransferase [Mucilaginibacter sp. KACC 22773]|uniref:class I SAM-dependent methyltransferase n=1 Tax=Mucilaginibacter sp. KACC 22773 TaxID=3025671 RepID=UPI0023660A6F|nr:class I SAM-dependent methyltransferase [Mucilaginibacter sp. KACC 22773]WDF81181.1 class I SAM-dependent methyltransferase [Mucilaginibacter sp. KACC 22773]